MRARMAKPVDAKDLKSLAFMACGFESRFGHQQQAKSPNPKPGIRKAENTLALTALTPTVVICSCAGQAGKRIRNLPIFQNLACYSSVRRSSGHYRLPLSASELAMSGHFAVVFLRRSGGSRSAFAARRTANSAQHMPAIEMRWSLQELGQGGCSPKVPIKIQTFQQQKTAEGRMRTPRPFVDRL